MERIWINYWIDFGLFITFTICGGTGIMKLPAFVRWFVSIGFPLSTLSFLHDVSGIILIILVFIHLMLHRKWISCMTKRLFEKKNEDEC